jgi:hypothetical protein
LCAIPDKELYKRNLAKKFTFVVDYELGLKAGGCRYFGNKNPPVVARGIDIKRISI